MRFVFALVLLLGLAAPAAAAPYTITAPTQGGLIDNPFGPSIDTVEISLDVDGVFKPLFATWTTDNRTAVLVGTDGTSIVDGLAGPQGAFTPTAAFAQVGLSAGETYTLSLFGTGVSTLSFEVAAVPLPAGVLLLGTAVAGLGLARRMRARAA